METESPLLNLCVRIALGCFFSLDVRFLRIPQCIPLTPKCARTSSTSVTSTSSHFDVIQPPAVAPFILCGSHVLPEYTLAECWTHAEPFQTLGLPLLPRAKLKLGGSAETAQFPDRTVSTPPPAMS